MLPHSSSQVAYRSGYVWQRSNVNCGPLELPGPLSHWIRLASQLRQLCPLPVLLLNFFRSHWSSLVASRSGSVRGKPSDPDTPSPGKDEQIEGVEARRQSQEAAEYTRLAILQIQAYLQGRDEQMEGGVRQDGRVRKLRNTPV